MTISPTKIQQALTGIEYPAQKEDLLAAAKQNNASEEVMSFLQDLPDQEYSSQTEISEKVPEMETV